MMSKTFFQKQPDLAKKADEFSEIFTAQDINSDQFILKWQAETQKFLEENFSNSSLKFLSIKR